MPFCRNSDRCNGALDELYGLLRNGESCMFTGVLALFERSLRIDARAWGPHLARFGLMAAIYVAVCYSSALSTRFGAPGLNFFTNIAYLNLAFMTLLGISFFSTAITEEKEEDTLGLMLMAGISPLGILAGKSGGRLVQAAFLIAVQYPFTLLAVTLGGVTQDQVWSATMGMLAYMVMLAGVGLFCSTLSTRNRSASFRLILIVIAYWVLPLVCQNLLIFAPNNSPYYQTFLTCVGESCIFIQMGKILASGFQETLWSFQVVTNLSLGALGFLLSWGLFGLAMREPSSEAQTRGLVTRSRSLAWVFSPGRPWRLPMVWKDFYFSTGGLGTILIRFAFYGLLWIVSSWITSGVFGGGFANNPKQTMELYLVLTMFAVTVDAGLVVSRSLSEEVRSQTLATLMLLPTSTGRILYSKIFGSLLGWIPGPVFLISAMTAFDDGRRSVSEFFWHPGPPAWLIAHLILVPHLAAVMAMYVRWGALALAIGMTIGSLFLSGSIFSALSVGDDAPIVWAVALLIWIISALCHLVVWLKAEALCAR